MPTIVLRGGGAALLLFDGRTVLVKVHISTSCKDMISIGDLIREKCAGPKGRMTVILQTEKGGNLFYEYVGMINTDESVEAIEERLRGLNPIYIDIKEAKPEDHAKETWEMVLAKVGP